DLAIRLEGVTVVSLLVRAAIASAGLHARSDDLNGAVAKADHAVALATGADLPWLEAQALFASAAHRRARGDVAAARADVRAAARLVAGLDVVVDATAAELLADL